VSNGLYWQPASVVYLISISHCILLVRQISTVSQSVFLLHCCNLQMRTVGDSVGFGVAVNIFSSVNKMTESSIGWLFFQQLFRMADSFMAVCFTQLWSIGIFEHNISQGSVATPLRCGRIFHYCFATN